MDDVFLKKIHSIQIFASHLAEDLLAGAYRSAFKGSGMEFEEVREYQLGDEVRNIDWNVTARMNHLFVKHFREERELTVFLLVDISSSVRFGGNSVSKREIIAEIAALLAFSALKNNDKVALIAFDEQVRLYLPPKKGQRHVLRLIREVLTAGRRQSGTDLKQPLSFFGKVQQRRSICFIISDFLCPDFSLDIALLAKKHDLIAINVADPYEVSFPKVKLTEIQDLETGAVAVVDTSFAARQEQYRQKGKSHSAYIKSIVQKSGGGFIDLPTNTSYVQALKKFFKGRRGPR